MERLVSEFNVTNWQQDGWYLVKVSQGTDFNFRDSMQVNVINGAVDTR